MKCSFAQAGRLHSEHGCNQSIFTTILSSRSARQQRERRVYPWPRALQSAAPSHGTWNFAQEPHRYEASFRHAKSSCLPGQRMFIVYLFTSSLLYRSMAPAAQPGCGSCACLSLRPGALLDCWTEIMIAGRRGLSTRPSSPWPPSTLSVGVHLTSRRATSHRAPALMRLASVSNPCRLLE